MALNTIHKNKQDLVNAYNITQNKVFKCEIAGEKEVQRVSASLGLNLPSNKLTLKVNGHSKVLDKDKIKVLNETYIVVAVKETFDKPEQFRKRADYEFFNGTSYIFLE